MQIKRNTLMWIVIAVLLVFVLYLTFANGDPSVASSTGGAGASAAKTAASTASYGGMVGGC